MHEKRCFLFVLNTLSFIVQPEKYISLKLYTCFGIVTFSFFTGTGRGDVHPDAKKGVQTGREENSLRGAVRGVPKV
jgi:hypothetical protein